MQPKKPLLVAALLFLFFVCHATTFDERYGIGTVHVVPYNFFTLDLFSHANDDSPYDRVSFSKDKSTLDLHFQFATAGPDTCPSWFAPEYFNTSAEGARIEMICLEKQGDWCKVLLNATISFSKWVHVGMDVQYHDWNAFFTSIASVEIISGDAKLYSKESASSSSEQLLTKMEAGGTQLIQPLKVDGTWMQVKVVKFTYNMEQTSSSTGWIKWHDDAGLLIIYNISPD